jgi:hypothetical protein
LSSTPPGSSAASVRIASTPGRFFYENAIMGIQLIEEARLAGVKKFVQLGTVCAYPKFAKIPFREEELWDGYPEETNAPYGIAKKALLEQLQSYRQEYGFNGIFLLPVNLHGPRDNFDLETQPRHSGHDPEVPRSQRPRRRRGRSVGRRLAEARVPLCPCIQSDWREKPERGSSRFGEVRFERARAFRYKEHASHLWGLPPRGMAVRVWRPSLSRSAVPECEQFSTGSGRASIQHR